MPKKPEPIIGEFVNESSQVYRMKNGERGVCVVWRDQHDGQKLSLTFNTNKRKTFTSNKPEIVSLDMAGVLIKSYPKSFEILPEMPNA